MSLDDVNIKHDVWRKVVAVIILAIVLLFVFILANYFGFSYG